MNRRARMLTVTCCALSTILATDAGAQGAPALEPETRVRVSDPAFPRCGRIGRLIAAEGDSAIVEAPFPETYSLNSNVPKCSAPLRRTVHLNDIEVAVGRGNNGLPWMRNGALIGLATGAILGYADGSDRPSHMIVSFSRSESAMMGGVAGLLLGGAIGGLFGLSSERDIWQPASGSPMTVRLLPGAGGRPLGMTLTISH